MVYLFLHFQANKTDKPKCYPILVWKWRMTVSGRRQAARWGDCRKVNGRISFKVIGTKTSHFRWVQSWLNACKVHLMDPDYKIGCYFLTSIYFDG